MEPLKPSVFILFGATGDLAKRKLFPALFKLDKHHRLHQNSIIIAFARKQKTTDQFRKEAKAYIKEFTSHEFDEATWKRLKQRIIYHRSEFHDTRGYFDLRKLLQRKCKLKPEACNTIFYLAAPSSQFETIIDNLLEANLTTENETSFSRIVFEKPFGHNLASAKRLNNVISKAFKEDQIYRIDHYLGKELVQNLLVLRFANNIFDPIWNKKYVDNVQITVAEDLGVGTRAGYYDRAGALRDMMQNHLMQLLALTAMEPPVNMQADDIRDEKVKALRSIHPFKVEDVGDIAVRGQYGAGVIGGDKVKAYQKEENVAKRSKTETFVALKLSVDNWRWAGVPFYLRTGKRLKERTAEIAIVFKKNPCTMFAKQQDKDHNMLVIRIQPEEGISLQFLAKVPGKRLAIQPVRMDFCHECTFGSNTPQDYEQLLWEVMHGDQTLFTRWDELKYAWHLVDKIADAWKRKKKVPIYKAGSWGPKEADELLARDGRKWYEPKPTIYSTLIKEKK